MTIETHNWASSAHQEFHKIIREENFPIVNQVDARVQNFEIQFLKEAAKFVGDFKSLTKESDASLAKHKILELEIERLLKAVVSQDIISVVQNASVVDTSDLQTKLEQVVKFVGDFKSLANEADASLAKHKALELEIERLLKAVISQDIMTIVQNASVIDTSVLQTELERTKERFENCIIKKESEYAKLWNDWYKKCDECKYDKISYDKAYNDMQQKIERLQAQEEKHVPNTVSASARTKPITVLQPPVITKKDVNSDSNGLSSTSSTKSWLWHQRLSYLNFDTINDLAKNDLVAGLPKFKYHKEHLCPSCEQRKSKRASHLPKLVPNSRQRLHLLHMDLCGPMRIASINGKRYVLVIVDDYSRYTWVHFLRSKDEAPEVIIKFLKRILVLLQSSVIIIRTDNGTEFKNQVLKEYFDTVGIPHQISSVRTPQQNGVVERQNRTLVEAARTMLIFSRASLFLWAEAIPTACFTQNHSIIHRRFNKTPYELINGRKSDISFLYEFGALCYPKNDREDIGKLGAKGDIGFFIGYSADSCAYRVYNRQTKKIMESMNVSFDELLAMAFEQR
nr:retrovirus-related Pol polyprotein from transposon TNT 1-94 [Tanacetum cinerariifolium]